MPRLDAILPAYRVDEPSREADGSASPRSGTAGESYRAWPTADGWLLALNGGHPDPVDPPGDPLPGLEYLVAYRLLAGNPTLLQLHAAGAQIGDRRILLLGDSGAGKSSITWALGARGHRVFGDDTVILDGSDLHPFRRWAKVHRVVAALPAPEDARGADRGELAIRAGAPWGADEWKIDPGALSGWAEAGPVTHIAHIRYGGAAPDWEAGGAGGGAVAPLGREMLLRSLMDAVLPTGIQGAEALDRLLPVAASVPCGSLVFGDCHAGARTLEAWVANGAPEAGS